jgi:hypothetical protein
MGANDLRRFIVKMEVYAAAGHVDVTPNPGVDPKQELSKVLEDLAAADPDEMEDQTYRCFRFDVCDACRKQLLARPRN